jgi:tetratricopeptide (TPR) repeat protein
MLTKKKKLSRKEIKEDKLVAFYYKVYGYIQENTSKVLLYAGVVVVVAAAGYFYVSNKIQENMAAGTELGQVMQLYDSGDYLEAIQGKPESNIVGLKKIVEDYGSTDNGEIAKMYLANSYNRLQKFDEALKYYEDYDGDNPIFKAAALAGQAGYYASQKQFDKAAELYQEAANVSAKNALNAEYLVNAATIYFDSNQRDKAKELFEKIKTDYPKTQPGSLAAKYLLSMS